MNLANSGYGTLLQSFGAIGSTGAQLASNIATSRVAKAERASELESAAYAERQYRRTAALTMGQARATIAASGVSASSGTPLLLQLDNARQAEMEALNIRRTGEIRARTYKTSVDYLTPISHGVAKTGSILSQWVTR